MTPSIILRSDVQRDHAIDRLRLLPLIPEGDAWGVWIAPYSKLRSLEQNAAYWRLIGKLVEAAGHDKEVWHEYFKRKVFGTVVTEIDGEIVERVPSSAKAKRGDFSELIEFVLQWMAEKGIPS